MNIKKQFTLFTLFSLISSFSISQIEVDSTDVIERTCFGDVYIGPMFLVLDSNNSIWNITTPNKSTINYTYQGPNYIVTDTNDFYPTNDTSDFYVLFTDCFACETDLSGGPSSTISGYYYSDTDSLNDFAIIEINTTNTNKWSNVFGDTVWLNDFNDYFLMNYFSTKYSFTGKTNGWREFFINLDPFFSTLREESGNDINSQDTIKIRFRFISDSIQDSLNGIAFDNIKFCDYIEGLSELSSSNFSIYPQPFTSSFTISSRSELTSPLSYQLVDVFGRTHLQGKLENQTQIIDAKDLPAGMYILKIDNGDGKSVGLRLIKY